MSYKLRIFEHPEGRFTIESYNSLKEYGRDGFWFKLTSYTHPLYELNYYTTLEDAEAAVAKVLENMKNPTVPPYGKIHKEYTSE